MHLCLTPFTLGIVIMAAMIDSAIVEELVTLTMGERVGLDREDERVTIGLPLPKGKVSPPDQLAVLRDGEPIPAEILSVNGWWEDGSLRWVHLIFPANCPARGKASVSLALTRNEHYILYFRTF
jgi:hypothetical protein